MAGAGSSLVSLLQTQVGTQSDWKTSATATAKLMGIKSFSLNAGVKSEVHYDQRGSLAGGHLTTVNEEMPSAKMEILALYEQIAYYLDNLLGQATPSGAGPYTRNYAAPGGTVPNPRHLTAIHGDATNFRRLVGLLISKATFKGENGKPMTATFDLIGASSGGGALAALTDATVQVVMGNHMAICIDTWAGTIGATQIDCSAYSYELVVDTKRKPDQFLGSLTACNYHEADGGEGWEGMLTLNMELNTATAAQLTAQNDSSAVYQRQVRLKSMSGTNILQFDFAGSSEESPDTYEDRDGVVTFRTALKRTYNPTLGNWFKAQSVNSLATL